MTKPPVPLNPRFPARVRLFLDRPLGGAPWLMECPPSAPESVGEEYIRVDIVDQLVAALDVAMADNPDWEGGKTMFRALLTKVAAH